ncbi:MAG TPA: radical SAM protein [Gemmatimonadales bacterium]|nr:radical SAM protein [Gemmatimonadales bacterium]
MRSILNSPASTGMDFWSVNPYVGCEFGCSYCYARFAHQYVVERGNQPWTPEDFERRIFVKSGAADALALAVRPSRLGGAAILIGTATDPYQPAEREHRITRGILERLAQFHGIGVGIITKSALITRDIDLLLRIAARGRLTVCISMIGINPALVRRLEPRTPLPAVRLRALSRLTAAGLNAGVLLAPVLPGITDGIPQLEALMRAARQAGAQFVRADPLRLYPALRRRFLDVVASEFPQFLKRYENAFDARGIVRPEYTAALKARVARLRRKHGVPEGTVGRWDSGTVGTEWSSPELQGQLPLGC